MWRRPQTAHSNQRSKVNQFSTYTIFNDGEPILSVLHPIAPLHKMWKLKYHVLKRGFS